MESPDFEDVDSDSKVIGSSDSFITQKEIDCFYNEFPEYIKKYKEVGYLSEKANLNPDKYGYAVGGEFTVKRDNHYLRVEFEFGEDDS